MPLTLRETPPLVPTFNIPEYDTTAASKLNPDTCDPTTMSTLTATVAPSYTVLAHRHAADVVDVHMLVLHAASATIADIVRSFEPKLSPLTVTESPPLLAAFAIEYDTIAASNVTMYSPVPTVPLTVTLAIGSDAATGPARHTTAVPDVHVLVVHTAWPITIVAVKSAEPKFNPLIVTEASPL